MTRSEAAKKLRVSIESAIRDAAWNGLKPDEIEAIVKGASIR
jgi:hypothetical protein